MDLMMEQPEDMPVERMSVWPREHTGDTEPDEAALVEAARRDLAAFGGLYQRYVTRVYRYLLAITHREDDAADLTQQVFVQALDGLPRYTARGTPFAAWLFRIARHAAIDDHRRKRPMIPWEAVPETRQPVAEGDPEAAALRRESRDELQRLLAGLAPDKREALALRFAAGLTAKEIAVVLGKSEAAIKKQLIHTLHSLKEQYHVE